MKDDQTSAPAGPAEWIGYGIALVVMVPVCTVALVVVCLYHLLVFVVVGLTAGVLIAGR